MSQTEEKKTHRIYKDVEQKKKMMPRDNDQEESKKSYGLPEIVKRAQAYKNVVKSWTVHKDTIRLDTEVSVYGKSGVDDIIYWLPRVEDEFMWVETKDDVMSAMRCFYVVTNEFGDKTVHIKYE